MRQVGVLAAAGLIALEDGPKHLHEDHANARLLAEALASTEGVAIDLASVETNIVVFRLQAGKGAADLRRGSRRAACWLEPSGRMPSGW